MEVLPGNFPAKVHLWCLLLALISPEAAELPAVVDLLEARGIAFRGLNRANELGLWKTCVVLYSKFFRLFSDFLYCHNYLLFITIGILSLNGHESLLSRIYSEKQVLIEISL